LTKSLKRKPYLTKSRYMQGLSCPKMLWLGWHDPVPYTEPEAGSPQQMGITVGEKAHLLFPGGVLIDEAPWEHDQAIERTRNLMTDPTVPAIFEAAFEYGGIRIRADIMERLGDNIWGLREVKASSGVKASYVDDVGVQLYVLRGLGIDVVSVELVHINTAYVRGKTGINWSAFFARSDLIQDAIEACRNVEANSSRFFGTLDQSEIPDIDAGKQCPSFCDFWGNCTKDKPDDWIFKLPRITETKFNELQAQGIEAIRDIPDSIELNVTQETIRQVWKNDEPYISPDLKEALQDFELPAYYLDFETMSPSIPLYPDTRPFQRIPFQWSLHYVNDKGDITHQEFLAHGDTDPSLEFATSLIDVLGGMDKPIIVYSSFEKSTLNALIKQFPHLSDDIQMIVNHLVDLLPVVRSNTYFHKYIPPHLSSDGKRHRELFDSKRAAKVEAHRRQNEIIRPHFNLHNRPQFVGMRLDEATKHWCARQEGRVALNKKRKSSLVTSLHRLKAVLDFMGTDDIGFIDEERLEQYQTYRQKNGKRPATINSELSVAISVLKWAKIKKFIFEVPQVEQLPVVLEDIEVPTQDEVNRIIRALPDRLKPLVKFMAETGCRSGEAFNLTWHDIDEINGIAHIRLKENGWAPKNPKSGRRVPLGSELLKALRELPKAGKYLFASRDNPNKPKNNFRKALKTAVNKAQIIRHGQPMHITPHLLRKAYITWQKERGTDEAIIQPLVGHAKGSKITSRYYMHFSDKYKREALLELPDRNVELREPSERGKKPN